jgi:alpha-N-arabinofuranosidase
MVSGRAGHNPGFLFQQNTMRDAMVAAINLNFFNRHSDRVVMAKYRSACKCLAGTAILTEGDKMVLTPPITV